MKISIDRCVEAIEDIEYNSCAEGCGLEDCGITDRYEAMEYGWMRAMEAVKESIELLG